MQENNFECLISTWRRMSGEQIESSALISMSGDSSSQPSFKKREEDGATLVLERPRGPIATAASATTMVAVDTEQKDPDPLNPEEKEDKPGFDNEKEESKEAAGDFKGDKDKNFLENESLPDNRCEKEQGDLVDSVFIRPPPPHKIRSNTSTNEDEDCGIKCLYYTLQCCDCVLM